MNLTQKTTSSTLTSDTSNQYTSGK